MTEINEKVWDVLTSDEQAAITLSLSHSKSTWEVGEIMGKSHYKYLEIAARAQRFFKLFSEYFTEHEELFPERLLICPSFQEYIEKSILKRIPVKTLIETMDDDRYRNFKKRKIELIDKMEILKRHSKGKDLYDLIMEFDRWNNRRIMPVEIQEPSAFKRRNKARDKNKLKLVTSLPDLTVELLIRRFKFKNKGKKYYLPILTELYELGYIVIPVKAETINQISNLGLHLFKKKEIAHEFAILVYDYVNREKGNCRSGQMFWPEYRVLSKKAINYNRLENIRVNRKYYEKTFNDNDLHIVRKRKEKRANKKLPTANMDPSKESQFWDK